MAKALLLNALVDVLGDFVEGLTAENLKVGVFSGKIVLRNLQLNREGIEKLNLPLTIVKGYLELLEIKIPWTSLDSQPVRINVDGVYLLVCPLDKTKYDTTEEGQKLLKKKQNDLIRAEKKIEFAAVLNSQAGEGKRKSNYFSNLVKKIVDNLEIKLCHIHIRYEDGVTFSGETFSCGCTLESFLVTTTDKEWSNTFVNRTAKKAGKDMSMNFKLAKSTNFGVYWNIRSPEFGNLGYEDWKNVMKKCITDIPVSCLPNSTTEKGSNALTYIIKPSNFGQLKIIHDETEKVVPQLSVRFESSDLKLHFDKLQLRQSMKAVSTMQVMQEKMHLLMHRPKKSAVVAPWDWWSYLLILMANKPDLLPRKATVAHICCHHRPRYMELLKKHRLALQKNSKASIDSRELDEITVMEALLPLQALVVFRQLVAKEVILLQHRGQLEKEKSKTTRRMSSFFKSHFGAKKKVSGDEVEDHGGDEEEEDISIQVLQHELEGAMQSSELNIDTLTLNFTASISQTLHVSSEWRPLIDVNASFTLDGEIRPNEMSSTLAMTNLMVVDRVTQFAVLPNLLSWQLPPSVRKAVNPQTPSLFSTPTPDLGPSVPFSLKVMKTPTCLSIHATSLPVEFCLNKPCVEEVVKLALYVVDSDALKAKVDANLQEVVHLYEASRRRALKRAYISKQRQEAEQASSQNLTVATGSSASDDLRIEISVELHAPKLIIPQDCTNDLLGCLRLDMGHLSLQGLVNQGNSNTMSWVVELSSMSADMPFAISDMYVGQEEELSEQAAACLRQVLDSHSGSSVDGREHRVHQNPQNYLIQPFGVAVAVQVSDAASSVVKADVKVHPQIDVELDVDKLSRLLRLGQLLLSILPDPPPSQPSVLLPNDRVQEVKTECATNQSYATAEHISSAKPQYVLKKKRTRRASPSDRYAGDLDEVTCLLELHMILPCLNLLLVYDNSTEVPSSVDISLQQVEFTLMNRGYDMTLQFDLGLIQVRDSLRAGSQVCIVRSREEECATSVATPCEEGMGEEDRHKLIHFSVQLIKNKRSPLYDSSLCCGCTVDAEFGQLFLILDPYSFLHFRPFYEVLVSQKDNTGANDRHFKTSTENSKELVKKIDDDSAPAGLTLNLLFQELSLSLLQQNSYNYARKVPLNQTFTFSFQDLSTDVQIATNDQIRAEVHIRAISLFDTRDISKNFYFRTVLRPMVSDVNHNRHPPIAPEHEHEFTDSSCSVIDLQGTTDQLSFLFEQSSSGNHEISVILRSICVYVSMDVIMEMVGTTIENVNAFLQTVDVPLPPPRGRTDSSSLDHEKPLTAKPASPINLSVSVRVPNPQLIFLEDPATEHSKAIVFRSNIDSAITKNSTNFNHEGDVGEIINSSEDVVQSVSVSVYDMELFMLHDMALWSPHQILSPVRIEIGLTQTFTCGKLMTASACVNMDDIKMKLSLNDIVLIQSILMRRSLSAPPSSTLEVSHERVSEAEVQRKAEEATSLVLVKAVFNLRVTVLTLVNDFHGYNTPILRCHLNESAFKLDGFVQDLAGSGFFTAAVDYYNPCIVEWEPLVEAWQPEVELSCNSQEVNVTGVAHQTLQLNITSTLLETLSSTYAELVTRNLSLSPVITSRQTPATITFINQLGVSVSLFDSSSGEFLFTLTPKSPATDSGDDNESSYVKASLFVGKGNKSTIRMQQAGVDSLCAVTMNYPEYINVHLDESSFTTDEPVLPRLCTTQINTCTARRVVELSLSHLKAALLATANVNDSAARGALIESDDGSDGRSDAFSAQQKLREEEHEEELKEKEHKAEEEVEVEKVEEEVYEYQRFNPMIFSKGWTDPFLPLDPPNFSNKAASDTKRPLHSVKLPPHGDWEWETPWSTDLSRGIVGKAIDKEGWDYAFDFADLLNRQISPRGKNQTLDCVRRRRWMRTRVRVVPVPTAPSSSRGCKSGKTDGIKTLAPDSNTSSFVIWDVAVQQNGKKVITLRSPMVISNNLPYPVKVRLQDGSVLGPIAENDTLAIPLRKIKYTTQLSVQPSDFPAEWSDMISCGHRVVDFSEQLDIFVSTRSSNSDNIHDYNDHTLPIRTLVRQKEHSIDVTLYSHVKIINALPCAIHFKIAKSYTDLKNQNIIDQKLMNAGDSSKLFFVNMRENNFITLCMPGPYGWSEPVDLKRQVDKKGRANIIFYAPAPTSSDEAPVIALLIRLQVQLHIGDVSTIEVFSNSAFVDYTGLDIAISSVVDKKTGESIKRVSYDEDGDDSHEEATKNLGTPDGDEDIVVNISNLVVKSALAYESIPHATPGSLLHSDRDYQFKYLPSFLINQSYIQTAANDRVTLIEGSTFLQFEVDCPCLVVLLVDIRVTQAPPWLKAEGFHLIRGERVVAVGKSFSHEEIELNYIMYGKCFRDGDRVSLGCNYSIDARNMYSVIVVPTGPGGRGTSSGASEVVEQVLHATRCDDTAGEFCPSDASWVGGGSGITLFNTETGRVEVGVKRGTVWSKQEINLRGLDSTSRKNGPFEVVDKVNGSIYQLVYTVHFLPSLFRRTKILTVMPRYCIVNCTEEPIYIRQYDKKYTLNDDWGNVCAHRHVTTAKPFRTTGWHQLQRQLDTKVQIRLGDSCWCWGYFNINEIGSSQVLLVKQNKKTGFSSIVEEKFAVVNGNDIEEEDKEAGLNSSPDIHNGAEFCPPVVINVDIKLASATDKCAVSVVFWTSSTALSSDLSITNDSKYAITVAQQDVPIEVKKTAKKYSSASGSKNELQSLLERQKQHIMHIPPFASIPFGWAFPGNASKKKKVVVGILRDSDFAFSSKGKSVVDLRKGGRQSGQKLYFPNADGSEVSQYRASLSVELHSHGSVIKVTENADLSAAAIMEDAELLSNIHVCSRLSSSNISAISELGGTSVGGSGSERGGSERGGSERGSVDEASQQQQICLSEAPKSTSRELNLCCRLTSLGVSIVADRPTRRELLSLYLDDIKLNTSKIEHIVTLELSVLDMQIDNYSETNIYPVLFRKVSEGTRSIDSEKKKTGEDKVCSRDIPFLQVALLRERATDTGSTTFKYLTGRVLQFAVEVDSGTLLLLLTDVLGNVKFLTPDQALAYANPQAWISRYNRQITSPIVTRELLDVYQAQCMTRTSRIFIEQLVLHPIKVFLTFMQTDLPKGRDESLTSSNALDTLVSVATVNSLEIRLNSFIVSDAVESASSLQARIVAKAAHDITGQLAQIVGSLQVIGNPANLVSNIGNGVQDFFYEPAQGLVQSPVAFLKGVHKGTSSLVSGVVSGTLTSAAALVGTASSGISYLSGDQEFVRKRAMQRQKQQATRGGALTGMKDGGESILAGFASGISGVVMKPIEGAEQEGALGFFKGVGKGIMGVAVKPVLGVTDGITSIVEGISNEVGKVNTDGYEQIRYSRTFKKSKKNDAMFVLVGVNLDATEGQHFVKSYATEKEILNGDIFYDMVAIDGSSDIIASENFLHFRKDSRTTKEKDTGRLHPSQRKCFSFPWKHVAYALLLEGNGSKSSSAEAVTGVELSVLRGDSGKLSPFLIPCPSLTCAALVYDMLLQNKGGMINSELMKDATSGSSHQTKCAALTVLSANISYSVADNSNKDRVLQRGKTVLNASTHCTFSYIYSSANNENLMEVESAEEMEGGDRSLPAGSEQELLSQACSRFSRGTGPESSIDEVARAVDRAVWWLLFKWNQLGFSASSSSAGTPSSVCCAALLINHSSRDVFLRRSDVVLGRGVWMARGTTYASSRSATVPGHATGQGVVCIPPHGCALTFATAGAPSTYESGNLEVTLHFSSSPGLTASFSPAAEAVEECDRDCDSTFKWNVSNQVSRCKISSGSCNRNAPNVFRVEFLEKTVADNWSKFVVLVTDTDHDNAKIRI